MNTDHRSETPLPELSAQRINEIEGALFADIGRDRAARQTAQRARRGRIWMGGAAAAAVIVVAAVIAPSVGSLIGGAAGTNESAVAPDAPAVDLGRGTDGGAVTESEGESAGSSIAGTEESASERDIITTASATVSVDDVTAAARAVSNAAAARDGYVESMNVGTSGEIPIDPATGIAYDAMTYPYNPEGAWVTVRVPTDQLPGLIDELSDVGQVTASSINRQDVTEQTVDLEARIEAGKASVDRLLELMSGATSTADLIAAESALAERQATLESYQQQLDSLEGMIELSSLTVTINPRVEPVEANPTGFGDGLAAGWNGLVATLNGIVVALGFLIPWIAVIAVAGLIVWGIVRLVRGARKGKDVPAPPSPEE